MTRARITAATTMTTSSRRHSRAPLRRSSAPEKIISAGLATATCVGIVGLIGVRTLDAKAAAPAPDVTVVEAPAQPAPVAQPLPSGVPATTSTGLTQAQLDDYTAQLEAERVRLEAYRAKLVQAAHRLQRQAGYRPGSGSSATATVAPASLATSQPAAKPAGRPAVKPASKPGSGSAGTTQQAAAPAAPDTPAAPAPAQPAPRPAAAPAQQQAPAPTTGGATTTTKAS